MFIQLVSIADRTFQEADLDKDSMLSFGDFCQFMEGIDVEQKMSIRFVN